MATIREIVANLEISLGRQLPRPANPVALVLADAHVVTDSTEHRHSPYVASHGLSAATAAAAIEMLPHQDAYNLVRYLQAGRIATVHWMVSNRTTWAMLHRRFLLQCSSRHHSQRGSITARLVATMIGGALTY